MDISQIIHIVVLAIIPLIFAITLHEAAHGWVASKLGDKTALMLGRVTLNPVKHIDVLGTLVIPIAILLISKFSFVFGWAKPVPVSWRNLHKPRRDMALVAIAGPGANLAMALFWAIIAKLCILIFNHPSANEVVRNTVTFIRLSATFGITINVVLLILNLMPIPPLDGSRIISSLLPPHASSVYEKIEPWGIWILLVLLITGVLAYIIGPPIIWMVTTIQSLFGIG